MLRMKVQSWHVQLNLIETLAWEYLDLIKAFYILLIRLQHVSGTRICKPLLHDITYFCNLLLDVRWLTSFQQDSDKLLFSQTNSDLLDQSFTKCIFLGL